MDEAKEIVVASRKGDKLLVWKKGMSAPIENAVLGNRWCDDEPIASDQATSHLRPGLGMDPPTLAVNCPLVFCALRFDVGFRIAKRRRVSRSLFKRRVGREINDPKL